MMSWVFVIVLACIIILILVNIPVDTPDDAYIECLTQKAESQCREMDSEMVSVRPEGYYSWGGYVYPNFKCIHNTTRELKKYLFQPSELEWCRVNKKGGD